MQSVDCCPGAGADTVLPNGTGRIPFESPDDGPEGHFEIAFVLASLCGEGPRLAATLGAITRDVNCDLFLKARNNACGGLGSRLRSLPFPAIRPSHIR
ncbi:hypothetical protein GCM10009565_53300 [Amycolatopsis albidoflavus]